MGLLKKARKKLESTRVSPPGLEGPALYEKYDKASEENQGSFSSNMKYLLREDEGVIPGWEPAQWNEQKQEEDRIAEEQQAAEEAARAAANAPKPIPLPDDDYIRTQRKKSLARQRRRGGRLSTILTPYNDRESLG